MIKFLIRNDDVGYDTSLSEIRNFANICDRHGYKIIQCISPMGVSGQKARAHLGNDQIRLLGFNRFAENRKLVEYLRSRDDLIAVHGLWHTHIPSLDEIKIAKNMLEELGLTPAYFVPPFNEGDYPDTIEGLKLSKLSMEDGQRLEDFLDEGEPQYPMMYLHSWRFNGKPYTLEQLDLCLKRLTPHIKKLSDLPLGPVRLWYNDWVFENALGKVLDIGKSKHWDYGFPTIDSNPRTNPTFVGNIQNIEFPDETFDTVLCNGLYEFVEDPQAMINEAIRITKRGGKTLFGFVGRSYKPCKKDWKYYSGKETLPDHDRYDIGDEYHYIVCTKK